MKSRIPIQGLALAGCLMAFAIQVEAQNHYAPGLEGLYAATLPPPGLYFRDYNYFYTADHFRNGPSDFNLFAYVQAPRAIWMTEWKPLGIDYGMDIIVPFAYTHVKFPGVHQSKFGLADISVEPVLLSKTIGVFDFAAGYAIWAPTGDFDAQRFDSPGKGFWTHMLTLGSTWHIDSQKTIALSLLNRYEINQEQSQTDITPGQTDTLEFGLSKTVSKGIDVGVSGYYQQQTTDNSGPNKQRNHILGLGPEIVALCPSIGLVTSLRYAYEFDAQNRPEGHTVCLTFTKRF